MIKISPSKRVQQELPSHNRKRHKGNTAGTPTTSNSTTNSTQPPTEPKFTFDQVKFLLDRILEDKKRDRTLVNRGLKELNYDSFVIDGHTAEQCKKLVEDLVNRTRQTRTLIEVLSEIKDNLERKSYTEIIQRATLDEVPKRPPSAYLLYHQKRYHELKHKYKKAAVVSKMVSEEWKNLPDREREKYKRMHDELVAQYEEKMRSLGLVDEEQPKRPTAKNLFIQSKLSKYNHMTKEEEKQLKAEFGAKFEELDKEKKKKWNDKAREAMEQYKLERDEFTNSHPHLKPKPIPKSRSSSAGHNSLPKTELPQPPRPPIKFYLDKKMPEDIRGEEAEELKKRLKDKFAHLKAAKLLKFIKKAIKDKDRYEEEVKEFLIEHPEFESQLTSKPAKANLTKEHWKIYQSMIEHRPSLPAPNSYLHFCGKLLAQDTYSSGIDPTHRMQKASDDWRNLNEKEKQQIEQEHADSVEQYIVEMQEWLNRIGPERKSQVLLEEPRSNPDYWVKKMKKSKKAKIKAGEEVEVDSD